MQRCVAVYLLCDMLPLLHDHMTPSLFVTLSLLLTHDSVTTCIGFYAMFCVSYSSSKLDFVMMQLTSRACERQSCKSVIFHITTRPMRRAAHVGECV